MKYLIFFLISVFTYAYNVLIINSYSIDLQWTKNELSGILKELNKHKSINKYIEFMDTKKFRPTPLMFINYYNYLSNKYENKNFDAIIVTDDNALNFVREYKNQKLFKNVKVFFCGINNLSLAKTLDKNRYTGVFEKKEPLKNLEFAKKIKDNLKTIYIVADASTSGNLVVKQYLKAFKNIKNINFIVVNYKDLNKVLKKLKNYDENSVMLYLTPFSFYMKNHHLSYIKATQKISSIYNNPMIVHADILVNIQKSNIVGGRVTDSLSQGIIVAMKVLEYFNGKKVLQIPYTFEKANRMYLNVINLEKFGINPYKLGYKDAIYINKPTSFWDLYKEWIIVFMIILVIVIVFLIVLGIKNRKLQEYNNKIKELNNSLEDKIKKAVEEITQKDKILAHQARLAAMGEMVNNIAHQWRQPLNALAINIQSLPEYIEDYGCDDESIDKFVSQNMKTIKFMSKTIDNFRDFFRDNSEKSNFSIKKSIEDTIKLINSQLKSKNIEILIQGDDFEVYGSKNQLQQVILNIVTNAKDAIVQNYSKGEIKITLDSKNRCINIEDNGGGIKEDIIDKIFEPYFSTKGLNGSGIGLYMTKIIIEKYFEGSIKASNIENGAKFSICFKNEIN